MSHHCFPDAFAERRGRVGAWDRRSQVNAICDATERRRLAMNPLTLDKLARRPELNILPVDAVPQNDFMEYRLLDRCYQRFFI